MDKAILKIEDDMLGFFLCWHGGSVFTVYKQNGQKLGMWSEPKKLTSEEAKQILLEKKETGEYLNILE